MAGHLERVRCGVAVGTGVWAATGKCNFEGSSDLYGNSETRRVVHAAGWLSYADSDAHPRRVGSALLLGPDVQTALRSIAQ